MHPHSLSPEVNDIMSVASRACSRYHPNYQISPSKRPRPYNRLHLAQSMLPFIPLPTRRYRPTRHCGIKMSLLSSSSSIPAEPHPDPQTLTQNPEPSNNTSSKVDYEPHPESSIPLEAGRQRIVDSICRLYSGSASEEDMMVYAEKAIYDDPWSYCDTRYKIAGQWYGKYAFSRLCLLG